MKTAILISLLCLATPALANLIGSAGDTTYNVGTTGTLGVLAGPAGGGRLLAMATDPQSGAAYAIDLGGWPVAPAEVVRLNQQGDVIASAVIIYGGAPIVLAESLAFSPAGDLYVGFGTGADLSYQSGHLGKLNPNTGAITSVVQLSGVGNAIPDADCLEFVGPQLLMGDNAFGWDTRLYALNQTTGVFALLGHTVSATTAYQVTDLAWDGERLYAASFDITGAGHLLRLDVATAAATLLGSTTQVIEGLTSVTCHGKKCQ